MFRMGISSFGERIRLVISRGLARMGMGESAFLVILAVAIGVVTAAAAVAFHELIIWIRDLLYTQVHGSILYGRWVWLLILFPAMGGLAVGIISKYIVRAKEGHGIVDVLESVIRSRGVIKPIIAIEKIVTSAITIGSGGSAGAEGPIVQIGASIASGIGRAFRVMRNSMPLLIGCGSAAGISAIFNSPIGGVLFVLEVILHDFSIRTFTPVVLASVVANITTQAIFRHIHHVEYGAIFDLPRWVKHAALGWNHVGNFIVLGILCGLAGVALTRLMYWSEERFGKLRFPTVLKPALGGTLLGAMGVIYIMLYGWALLGQYKPFPQYPMPAFFGDGYGVIRRLLEADFYHVSAEQLGLALLLVSSLVLIKVVGTCLTLGSGGSGGIIAPSLFLGAAVGATLGLLLQRTGWFPDLQPDMYAMAGMGAVLGAVVHAPLAAILILLDVTQDNKVLLPGMLATITATAIARMIFKDSIYTLALRRRGVHVGGSVSLLHRLTVEQAELEPALIVDACDPLEKVVELVADRGVDVTVVRDGAYAGMITSRDLQTALWQREALPLLTAGELVREDIDAVTTTDDLAAVLEEFTRLDVPRLPVCLPQAPEKIIGLISRSALLRRYHRSVTEGG